MENQYLNTAIELRGVDIMKAIVFHEPGGIDKLKYEENYTVRR